MHLKMGQEQNEHAVEQKYNNHLLEESELRALQSEIATQLLTSRERAPPHPLQ